MSRNGEPVSHRDPQVRDVDLGGPYIYASGVRIKAVQDRCTGLLAAPSFSRHGSPLNGSAMRVGPNCAKESTLLIGIDVPQYEAAVTTDLSTESGTILLNGLPKDAPLWFSAYLPARIDPSMIAHHQLRLSSLPA